MRQVSKKRAAARQSEAGRKYADFLRDTDKPWCWACGEIPKYRPLDRAHLSAGSGCCMREEDIRLVNILCRSCHEIHRHQTARIGYPCNLVTPEYYVGIVDEITDANMLWLKRERDPGNWDWDFICEHWRGNRPPEPKELVWLREVYERRRG